MGTPIQTWHDLTTYMMNYIPDFALIRREDITLALPLAGQLALLGYLDSLLTSLVIDKLTHTETKKNKELIAQGIANAFVCMI